jgi:hypothetical protein
MRPVERGYALPRAAPPVQRGLLLRGPMVALGDRARCALSFAWSAEVSLLGRRLRYCPSDANVVLFAR